jgi:hypothetical protein
MASPRVNAPLVKLANGKVLIAGGNDGVVGAVNTAEIYDPATGGWSAAATMVAPVSSHSMVLLPSGQVLAAGSNNLASQLYDPVGNVWKGVGIPFDDAL